MILINIIRQWRLEKATPQVPSKEESQKSLQINVNKRWSWFLGTVVYLVIPIYMGKKNLHIEKKHNLRTESGIFFWKFTIIESRFTSPICDKQSMTHKLSEAPNLLAVQVISFELEAIEFNWLVDLLVAYDPSTIKLEFEKTLLMNIISLTLIGLTISIYTVYWACKWGWRSRNFHGCSFEQNMHFTPAIYSR